MIEADIPFTVHVEGRDGEVTIVATGDLDPSTAPSVAAILHQHRGDDVLLDLTQVGFADISIVRTLVAERDHAERSGTRFAIAGAGAGVRSAFEALGVAGLFEWS